LRFRYHAAKVHHCAPKLRAANTADKSFLESSALFIIINPEKKSFYHVTREETFTVLGCIVCAVGELFGLITGRSFGIRSSLLSISAHTLEELYVRVDLTIGLRALVIAIETDFVEATRGIRTTIRIEAPFKIGAFLAEGLFASANHITSNPQS
jgi:hypothetical protein